MKLVSETKSIEKLAAVRERFRSEIGKFESRAEPCAACTTPGACCLDAHFVNVRISRLEAAAMRLALAELPATIRLGVEARIDDAIVTYGLDGGRDATYACPLYQKGVGCLVHASAKPLPCIAHACYENASDLPPDALLDAAESEIAKLNQRTYGRDTSISSIPIAIRTAL